MIIKTSKRLAANPEDDNGIVLFAPDRLFLEELVAHFSPPEHMDLLTEEFRSLRDLRAVMRFFSRRGSSRAKGLAEEIRTRGRASISKCRGDGWRW